MNEKIATFGAGCFWGVEARFRAREGVVEATSGYMGGHKREPTYREVCAGDTGHAEVVEVRYDPDRVRYDELLELFFSIHDPTQLDRQGPDVGAQYRSAIFTHDDDQAGLARAAIERLTADGRFDQPIVTRVEPAGTFWRAEEYHQRYLDKNGVDACPF